MSDSSNQLNFSQALETAVRTPGAIMEAYSAFHNYSIGNQILALIQCRARGIQSGPIKTFKGWQAHGRFVKKGERALILCMPITFKHKAAETEPGGLDSDDAFTTAFVYKPRWFVLSQTDGQEIELPTLPTWNAETALKNLNITQVPFIDTDGNSQGYARLCCRQHKRSYVAKSVMWRRVVLRCKDGRSSICTPHKFSSL